MKESDKELNEKILKIQLLSEKKRALELELEKIELEIRAIMSKEKLISFDPVRNIYILNVNYRA